MPCPRELRSHVTQTTRNVLGVRIFVEDDDDENDDGLMRMTTKAHRPAGLDVDVPPTQVVAASHSSPKNNGNISIAELRSRFQKQDDRFRSCPISEAKPSQHVVQPRPPLPVKPIGAGSGAPPDVAPKSALLNRQPEIIREMKEKFGANNSLSSTMPSLPKKKQQPTVVSDNAPSSLGHVVLKPMTKPQPLAATKSNRPASDGGGQSPFKVPSSNSSPKNTRANQTPPISSSTSSSTPKMTIRPNPSHLSSLITEIHQQQLQQQLQNKVGQQRLECEPLPRPPAVVPTARSSTPPPPPPPPSLHRKTPSVDLGPPPPIPLDFKPSPVVAQRAPSPKQHWRRKVVPSLAELGPPPAKPPRPPFIKLANGSRLVTARQEPVPTPPLPQRNPAKNASTLPKPPRQSKPVPTLPVPLPAAEIQQTASVMTSEMKSLPSLPIPEFTEEEELGETVTEDFYDDTDGPNRTSSLISDVAQYSSGSASQQDDLYQDASIRTDEADDVYEDIGVGGQSSRLSDVSSLTYTSKREEERHRREEERRLKREQKEKEKKARETEKIRKRFNLSGNEAPVYTGIVKESTKGRRREDLVVKKGDRVSILRIGENPIGKWLALNDDGKVGYVDLTNIEVDADSIRYVSNPRWLLACSNFKSFSFRLFLHLMLRFFLLS